MTCSFCANEITADARFCSRCGHAIIPSAYAYAPVPPLVRPLQGRMLAGVCAGIALRCGWDPVLVRLVLVALVLGAGTGILAYLIAWIVIPNESRFIYPVTSQPPAPTSATPAS